MLLSEILTIILTRSGQLFFLSTETNPLHCFGLTMEHFWRGIAQHQLALYEKYRPLTFKFNRRALYTGRYGSSVIIFGADSVEDPGAADASDVHDARVGTFNRDPGLVPQWLSGVIPTEYFSSQTAGLLFNRSFYRRQDTVYEPRNYIWRYEKDDAHGILYVSEEGQVEVSANYDFPREAIYDSLSALADVDILYLEEGRDTIFFDLVLGQFLQIIGRSRRAFAIDQNPVIFDASDLVLEGKEIYDKAKEELYDQSRFYLAVRI